jgi:hypothetical protein
MLTDAEDEDTTNSLKIVAAALKEIAYIQVGVECEIEDEINKRLAAHIAEVEFGLVRDLAAAGDSSAAVYEALTLYRLRRGPVGQLTSLHYPQP